MFDGTAEQAFRKWDHSGEIETADSFRFNTKTTNDILLKLPII